MSSVVAASSLERPARGERARAVRRAALFLLVCSPLWLAPRAIWQGYPFTLPVLVGLSLLFLRREHRPGDAIGLSLCCAERASSLAVLPARQC